MHLVHENAETVDRLVEQGVLLLQAFHAECESDPSGHEAEFLRGNFTGWRSTLRTLYHDCAEEIVDRVWIKTGLAIPQGGSHSGSVNSIRPDTPVQ